MSMSQAKAVFRSPIEAQGSVETGAEARARRGAGAGDAVPNLSLRVHGSLAECEAAFRALEAGSDVRVFQSLAWLRAWSESFGGDVAPRIVVGSRAGEPCLIVPLGLRRRLGARVLGWLGDPWNDYNAPLVAPDLALPTDPAEVARLWGEIAALAGPADLVELAKEAPSLAGGRPNPLLHPARVHEDNRAYALALDAQMAHGPIRGGRTFNALDRKWRRLVREGEPSLDRIPRGPQAARAVARMLEWKDGALRARGASNPFADPRSRSFLAAVAADETARTRTIALHLSGEPIAVALCLEDPGELLIYQTAYDPRLARNSPGAHLLRHLIRTAAAEGFECLDFAFGDDGYKTDICTRTTIVTRALVPASPIGRLIAAGSRVRLAARRSVKGNDFLYRTALRLNRLRHAWRRPGETTERGGD